MKLVDFWENIKPLNKNGYIEIRLTPTNFRSDKEKGEFFNKLNLIKKQLNILNNKVSFFINNYEELDKIITWEGSYFLNHGKICYGVNERFNNNGIDGSYNSLKYYRYVYFDIDADGELEGVRKELFNKYCEQVILYLLRYNLNYPTIIHSGGGRHLLYKIPQQLITLNKRAWMKQIMKDMERDLKNTEFKFDALHDATRVLSLPTALNVKREKWVKIEVIDNKINDFKIKFIKPEKIKEVSFNLPLDKRIKMVVNSPLTQQLIKNKLPEGGRNNILIFQLKIMLKLLKFTEKDDFVIKLFNKIQQTQQERFPKNLPITAVKFNKNVINNYFINNNLPIIFK